MYPPKEELEKKIWYRIAKVVYMLSLVALAGLSLISGVVKYTNKDPDLKLVGKRVVCSDSNTYYTEAYNFKDIPGDTLKGICNPATAFLKPFELPPAPSVIAPLNDEAKYKEWQAQRERYEQARYPLKVMDVELVTEEVGSYSSAILYGLRSFAVILVIGLLIIYFVRKIVLYIILGPKKIQG